MIENDLMLMFPKAGKHAFFFENAHLLLLSWERDNAKFLFLIDGQTEDGVSLEFPGELFTNQVLDTIENIFFIQVNEGEQVTKYTLGSYFLVNTNQYAAYYERDAENPTVVLFRLSGESPDFDLEVLEEEEFQIVSDAFTEQHRNFMDIRQQ
jgi:hypothetical protein